MVDPNPACGAWANSHRGLSARVNRDKLPAVEERLNLRILSIGAGLNHDWPATETAQLRITTPVRASVEERRRCP
jgi:hypothetical protein